jgi:hypothetical protein
MNLTASSNTVGDVSKSGFIASRSLAKVYACNFSILLSIFTYYIIYDAEHYAFYFRPQIDCIKIRNDSFQ